MDEMDTLSNSRPGEGSFRPQSQLSHLHHGRTKFKSLNSSSRLAQMPQSKPVEKRNSKSPLKPEVTIKQSKHNPGTRAETVNSTAKAKSSAVCSQQSHRWNRQSSPPTARSRGNPLKTYRKNRLNFLIYADFKCLRLETHSQVFKTQCKTQMDLMMRVFVLGHRRICLKGPLELYNITAQDSSKNQR